MEPVAVALVVFLVLVAGLVVAVLWWRRQESRRVGPDADGTVSESLRDPAQERRRRDSRHKGLMN